MDCAAQSGQLSPYSPQSCRFYGYDHAGEEPVEAPLTDYSLSGGSLTFTWESDNALHVIVELDGVRVDIPVSAADSAAAGDVFEGSSGGVLVRMTFVSRTDLAAATTYVFSLSSAPVGPALSLASTSASGETSVQKVDMSCLNDRLTSVSASFSCDADGYEPDYCGFFGYDNAGDSLTPLPDVSYSLSGNTLSFSWSDNAHRHAVIVFDNIFTADISIFNASEGDSFDAYSENPSVSVHMLLDSVSRSGNTDSFVFRLTVGQPNPVLSLVSAKADGTSYSQTVDMSCLVPPVFNGTNNGLVPRDSSGSGLKVLCSDGLWRTLAELSEV